MEQKVFQLVDERPEQGVFRMHRDAFRDKDIFAAGLKHLFEGGWAFAGHASQIRNPHDYASATIGQQPVVCMRAADCHDLQPVGAFVEYRGFLFARLSADVAPLHDYLGDTCLFIDMIVDQSEQGIELVPGTVTYTF